MAKLTVREQGKEKVYEIQEKELTIGRVGENQIPIKDPKSSRKHCKIFLTPEGFKLLDLKSRNGLFLNGKPVQESLLKTGDKIEIGDTVIVFDEGTAPSTSPLPSGKWILKITSGPQKGKTLPLGQEPFLLGRHKAADLQLEDEKISSHHAQILPSEGGYAITDLNSAEGTFVNGKKIKKINLKPEMVITLGKTHIRFCQAEEEAPSTVSQSMEVREIKLDDDEEESSENKEIKKEENKESRRASAKVPASKESAPLPKKKKSESPSLVPAPILEEDSSMPSQADFEAVNLEGMVESSATLTVLTTIGASVLFVFFLIFGIHFIYKILTPEPVDPSKKGNLVKNWSFETGQQNQALNWKLSSGASLDREQALGGNVSLRLDGMAKTNPQAITDKILIVPKKSYFLRVYQKMEGAGPSGVKVIWLNEDTGYSRENFLDLVESTKNWREISALLYPPQSANALQIVCYTLGKSGVSWFDRVSLEERNEEDDPAEPLFIDLEEDFLVKIQPKGILSLYLGKNPKLNFMDGEFQIASFGPSSLSTQLLAIITKGPTLKEQESTLEGRIFLKEENKWFSFEEIVKRKDDRIEVIFRLLDSPPPGRMGFTFQKIQPDPLEVPSDPKSYSGNFELKAGEVTWGKTDSKVVLHFPQEVSIKGFVEGKRHYISLTSSSKEISFWLTKTSQVEKDEKAQKMGVALALEKEEKMEEALEAWKDLKKKFFYKPLLVEKCEEKIKELESLREQGKKELENIRQDLENLQSLFVIQSSRKKCEALAKSFPGLAGEIGRTLQTVDLAEKKMKEQQNKNQARKLLEKAKELLGRGLETEDSATLAMAGAYFKEILQHYGDDPLITREAQHKLDLIYERMDHKIKKVLKR